MRAALLDITRYMRIALLGLENKDVRDRITKETGLTDLEQVHVWDELKKQLNSEEPLLVITVQPEGEQVMVSGYQGSLKHGLVHQETKAMPASLLTEESLAFIGL
jgi:hypothetical protein